MRAVFSARLLLVPAALLAAACDDWSKWAGCDGAGAGRRCGRRWCAGWRQWPAPDPDVIPSAASDLLTRRRPRRSRSLSPRGPPRT